MARYWVGLRPVCADDLPIVGKSCVFDNLYWNVGHGGRGVAQAPGWAKLLEAVVTGDREVAERVRERVDPGQYCPRRFGI